MRASLENFTFSHSKTAISFNIFLVLHMSQKHIHSMYRVPTTNICTYIARASASETYIFRTQIHLHTYTINAVSFNYLWYMAL